jgi:hypothetical protein
LDGHRGRGRPDHHGDDSDDDRHQDEDQDGDADHDRDGHRTGSDEDGHADDDRHGAGAHDHRGRPDHQRERAASQNTNGSGDSVPAWGWIVIGLGVVAFAIAMYLLGHDRGRRDAGTSARHARTAAQGSTAQPNQR